MLKLEPEKFASGKTSVLFTYCPFYILGYFFWETLDICYSFCLCLLAKWWWCLWRRKYCPWGRRTLARVTYQISYALWIILNVVPPGPHIFSSLFCLCSQSFMPIPPRSSFFVNRFLMLPVKITKFKLSLL